MAKQKTERRTSRCRPNRRAVTRHRIRAEAAARGILRHLHPSTAPGAHDVAWIADMLLAFAAGCTEEDLLRQATREQKPGVPRRVHRTIAQLARRSAALRPFVEKEGAR